MGARDDAKRLATWLTSNAAQKGTERYSAVTKAFRTADALADKEAQDIGQQGRDFAQGVVDRAKTAPPPTAMEASKQVFDAIGLPAIAAYQGATLGFGDELAGLGAGMSTSLIPRKKGVQSLITGEEDDPYAKARDSVRGAEAEYERRSPTGSLVAHLAGGLAPTALLPGSILAGTGTLGARATAAGLSGAGLGGAAGFGSGEGGFANRLISGGIGAGLGGALGLAGEVGASAIGRLVSARPGLSGDIPKPFQLTPGQATGDVGQQMREFSLARGGEGTDAARVMASFRDQQQGALGENAQAIQANIAGAGNPLIRRGAGGEAVSNRLNDIAEAAKARVTGNYEAARAIGTGAQIEGGAAKPYLQNIADILKQGHAPEDIPKVVGKIDALAAKADSAPLTVREIFETRARLKNVQRGGGQDAVAAGEAVSGMDKFIGDAMAKDLISGDQAAVGAWKKSIKEYKEYADIFKQRDLVGDLVKRDPQQGFALKVKPEDAVNYILGRGDLGSIGKRDLASGLNKLRSVLGEDSQEYRALGQEMFMRMINDATKKGEIQGGALKSAIKDLKDQAPLVYERLIPGEARNIIDRYADIAEKVTSIKPQVFGPSVTPYQMARLGKALNNLAARLVPYFGPAAVESLQKAASRRAALEVTRGVTPRVSGREIPALVIGGTQLALPSPATGR